MFQTPFCSYGHESGKYVPQTIIYKMIFSPNIPETVPQNVIRPNA